MLVQAGDAAVADQERFIGQCLTLGHQWGLRRRIASEESNSAEMFRNALKLAANRDLLEAGPELFARRAEFDREIIGVLHRLDDIACRMPTR
jgi:glycerol-3-phosphate O-acyltransferase